MVPIRDRPDPTVWRDPPVSPPIWNTKSFALLVETPVSHGSELRQPGLFACAMGRVGFVSKGVAVLAPETPKATTPYQVSPVLVVVTEITSEERALGAIAYHSCKNWFPPMLSSPVLA